MKRELILLCICTLALSVGVMVAQSPEKTTTAPAAKSSDDPSGTCLKCHGPFEKLISAPANYEVEDGKKVNPHKYIPHDQKEVPKCTECHKPHPVPRESKEKLTNANVEMCYSQCHHMRNFQPCKDCH